MPNSIHHKRIVVNKEGDIMFIIGLSFADSQAPRQRPDRRSLAATDDRVRTRVPGSGPGPGRSSSSTVVRAMASGARRIEPPDEKSNGRGGLRTQSPFFHLLGSRCVYVYHPRAYKSQNSFGTPGVGFSESISGMGAV